MPAQYTIGGCQVHFPHQAYGVQLSFMNKVIAALEGGHNALLEAPTGSGKTLSLLCSALAWQVREKQRIEEGLAAEKAAEAAARNAAAAAADGSPCVDPTADPDACCGGGKSCEAAETPEWTATTDPGSAEAGKQRASASPGDNGFMPAAEGEGPEPPPRRRKPPKIYYATRTHSQISQVVKELKRSEYKPRMAVLGSRKHYCINMHATRQTSIDEACEELLKESQCQYFKNVHSFAVSGYQYRLHDIEDLKGFGKAHKACPYYTARKWTDEAEVIFCPYSYLIDPVIRRAMAVEVEGCMLIFDEAHNIEDVCREAASVELDLATMLEVLVALRKAAELNGKPEVYGPLAACAGAIVAWMQDKERVAVEQMQRQPVAPGRGGGGRQGGASRHHDPYERLFPANQMMSELAACGLGPDNVDPLWEAYQAAREEEEAMNASEGGGGGGAGGGAGGGRDGKENQVGDAPGAAPKDTAVRVGALALGIMSRLIQVVRMVHQGSDDGARDYRLVVQRMYEHEPALTMGRYKSKGRAADDDGADTFLPGFSFKMCLWSMNPAVAFKPVADSAHSVVLTSGTLAPLEGFASELGTPFAITLEAPHVVNMRRQVWAGVVGTGPGGTPLVATYKNQVEPPFQDAVGRVVVDTAAAVPDGLLVFMPSYSLLDRLMARWKSTGALKKLEGLKKVVQEPRGGGQDALKKTMQEYYAAIQKGGGAVFFAVCRGKVSEGLDFADGNARGVIIVGIPFPHARDLKVNEKKAFNDRGHRQLGLVSGDTWYSQQAFRALNQALGRCIRHRLDWGAILMVDDRFRQPRNQRMLSRWVRGALAVHPSFEAGLASMQNFFTVIQADPPEGAQPAAKSSDQGGSSVGTQAAIDAAVAAAGPLPQQAQQPEEAPAGRGAEGALGLWGGTAAAPAVLDVWQGKPLGLARMSQHQGQGQGARQQDAAATAAMARWAPHPGLPPVKQEGLGDGGFMLPQTQAYQKWPDALGGQAQQVQQAQQPTVKLEPQHPGPAMQHPAVKLEPQDPGPAMQQQQQQQHPPQTRGSGQQQQHPAVKPEPQEWGSGPHHQQQQQQQEPLEPNPAPAGGCASRQPGSREATALAPGTVARLRAAVARAPISQWVHADVADFIAFIHSNVDPDHPLLAGFASVEAVAVAGVGDAFAAASELLAQGGSLQSMVADWSCSLPRGLQAVLAATPGGVPPGKSFDAGACAFGAGLQQLGCSDLLLLVQAMQQVYTPCLDQLQSGSGAGLPAPQPLAGAQASDGAADGSASVLSPRWQRRADQLRRWQQDSAGRGGGVSGAEPRSPTHCIETTSVERDAALAATPPMEWAQRPAAQQAQQAGQRPQSAAGPAAPPRQQSQLGVPPPAAQHPQSHQQQQHPHGHAQQQQHGWRPSSAGGLAGPQHSRQQQGQGQSQWAPRPAHLQQQQPGHPQQGRPLEAHGGGMQGQQGQRPGSAQPGMQHHPHGFAPGPQPQQWQRPRPAHQPHVPQHPQQPPPKQWSAQAKAQAQVQVRPKGPVAPGLQHPHQQCHAGVQPAGQAPLGQEQGWRPPGVQEQQQCAQPQAQQARQQQQQQQSAPTLPQHGQQQGTDPRAQPAHGQQPGQACKRAGADSDSAGSGQPPKKRYLRGKNAEEAVRTRAGASATSTAAAMEAAQRAADGNAVLHDDGTGGFSSDDDFQDRPQRR